MAKKKGSGAGWRERWVIERIGGCKEVCKRGEWHERLREAMGY